MKEQIRALKLNLKEIAVTIRNQKKFRKQSHPDHTLYRGNYHLQCLKHEFRHKHVAYCLVRGRTLEQVDSGNKLDMDYVNWIIKTMQPDSKEKLYVVVNQKLTAAQQAVQSAHAVAEFMKKNPHTMWSNGYLILLKDSPGYDGNMVMGSYYSFNPVERANFCEPDLGNKITAYALFGPYVEKRLKNMQLL
jgi:hypothetical protein